ncbi:MAG TPA: class I SAM-dependent methyltransferase [Caulobacteraceae bacterium]|jgi:methyltransferase (TIGR00027 family)|nr:class I SAM-dependent methyltransferase [Caulobacteraceae bacterium]
MERSRLQEQQPSRTALGAAGHRAAHQVFEEGRIFKDPLALQILGEHRDAVLADPRARRRAVGLRLFIALRSAIAERALASGVETRGVTQAVILGAGLDTFACRNPFEGRLKVFEVDHPATQAWKRRRLAETGIAIPDSMVFTPVDLEREPLMEALTAAGFDPDRRTFFVWLGVTYYLTREAILTTLGVIGGLPGGGEVAFDYGEPPDRMAWLWRRGHRRLARRVAEAGEPFVSSFEPKELHAALRERGFTTIDDRGPRELFGRVSKTPTWLLPKRGAHVCVART